MDDKNTQILLNAINTMKNNIDKRFDSIDKKFDKYDKKFDKYDKKFDIYDKKFNEYDKKFNEYDKKFNEYDKKFNIYDKKFDTIHQELTSLGNIVTRMEVEYGNKIQIGLEYFSIAMEKIDNLQNSVNEINSKLDAHDLRIQILEEKVL